MAYTAFDKSNTQLWLRRFDLHPEMRGHIAFVLDSLPQAVREDLMTDAGFRICDMQPQPWGGYQVPVGPLTGDASSRAVVLKQSALNRSTTFVRWLIAHELAHAHLRNEGRAEHEDPENAADALALEWGFPRP